ncbi:MAG: hypothetical protein ACP5FH_02895 [Terracidiphilus sp.]
MPEPIDGADATEALRSAARLIGLMRRFQAQKAGPAKPGKAGRRRRLEPAAQSREFGSNSTAGASCTVNVTFNPQTPGMRPGAVLREDSSGDILAAAFVGGVGNGPLLLSSSSAVLPLYPKLTAPSGWALDSAGNLCMAAQVPPGEQAAGDRRHHHRVMRPDPGLGSFPPHKGRGEVTSDVRSRRAATVFRSDHRRQAA